MIQASTGTSGVISAPFFTKAAIQASGGTASVILQQSIDGTNWANVGSASTFAANAIRQYTTGIGASRLRMSVTAVGSTAVKVFLQGA